MPPANGVPSGFWPAVGAMPATAQWMYSALSSTISSAISTVPAGGAVQLISGEISPPSHVYFGSMAAPSAQGRITVNGQALDESSYLYTDPDDDQINPSDVRFEVVVPKDRIFVMGDHRDLSADSRCHLSDLSTSQGKGQVAFVPTDLVVGPAFAIAAPFDRAGRLRQPATFEKVPAPRDPAPERAVIKPAGVSC